MATRTLGNTELRKTIRFYNQAKGNLVKAAGLEGIPRSTFQNKLCRAQAKFPELVKDFPRERGGHAKRTDELLDQVWAAFCRNGFHQANAARELGILATTFHGHLNEFAKRHTLDLSALKPEANLDNTVASHRMSAERSGDRSKLKDAARRIVELEDRIKDLEWGMKARFEPADWTLSTFATKKREHIPALIFSDAQIGEVIRAEETETGYGYDSEIFRRRYRHMIDTTIYLSFNHGGQGWTYPGIVYARLGDTISGAIHDELKETDDLTPIEAVQLAFEEEAAGIEKLADAFGRVEVESPGGAGNHDRNLVKPTTKKAWAHSYDYLIMVMLANHFKHDKRVTFHTSKSFDIRFNIYERKIIGTHGDRMGSGGGQGFIGPAATILRGVQKVLAEQATLGFHLDEVWHGHFHYEMHLPFVKSNGCFPGYSEYAKQYRMRPALPMQQLNYYHAKRGNVDYKPLILAEN